MSSKNVIPALESVISEYGNEEKVISNNVKELMAQESKNFAAHYEFKLTTSSLYHPKCHGLLKWQKKRSSSNVRWMVPCIAMLEQRAMPLDDSMPSPAELLGNRK